MNEERRQNVRKANACRVTHGHSRGGVLSPEYRTWANIKTRCFNPKASNYSYYGGRGITVAPELAASFEKFLDEVGPKPTPRHTIERIDNSKGYIQGNLRWATRRENARNTRRNYVVSDACLAEWAERLNVPAQLLYDRRRHGWVGQRILRPRRASRMLTLNGTTLCVNAWARKLGVYPTLLYGRLRLGWSAEEILAV